jgi:ubiquinone/menaquinone biosynthesis C-methylase UbiE
MKTRESFTQVNRAEWDNRAELFKDRHPAIVRGNTSEGAVHEIESNCRLFEGLLKPCATDAFFEAGCGNALYLQYFAPKVGRAYGLDLSLNMLRRAREGADKLGVALHLSEGSAHALPFADASFDKLLNNGMIEYLPVDVVPQFFREVRRVLKPGGLALIAEVPLRSCLYGLHNRLVDIARNVKRGLQGRPPVIYSRFSVSGCARELELAGLRVLKHSTHQYSTAFLPRGVARYILQRCYASGEYSQLFSGYYLFLCTRDER